MEGANKKGGVSGCFFLCNDVLVKADVCETGVTKKKPL